MLFRPVYGPELEVTYNLLAQSNAPLSRQSIHQVFLPSYKDKRTVSPQSIDDALSFLLSALLVKENNGFRLTNAKFKELPFRLILISQLQKLANQMVSPNHEIDMLYFSLLNELFIKPDKQFVMNVHADANKLRAVTEIGGLSQEKIRSWKRVMAFLGIGRRVAKGFQCIYSPDLLQEIISIWHVKEGIIQEFLEGHFQTFLPYQTQSGGLAQAVTQPLGYLQQQQTIQLRTYQDSSSKPYFGQRRWRYMVSEDGVI